MTSLTSGEGGRLSSLPAAEFVVDSRVYQLNVSGVARELITGW
jgi:hypothetical protein